MSQVREYGRPEAQAQAYGWFSRTCLENTDCKPIVYETPDGVSVVAFGVCSTADLTSIKWSDKMCVGAVNPKTARKCEKGAERNYMTHVKALEAVRRYSRLMSSGTVVFAGENI